MSEPISFGHFRGGVLETTKRMVSIKESTKDSVYSQYICGRSIRPIRILAADNPLSKAYCLDILPWHILDSF